MFLTFIPKIVLAHKLDMQGCDEKSAILNLQTMLEKQNIITGSLKNSIKN